MEQFKIKPPTRAQILGQLSLQLLPVILLFTAALLGVRLFNFSSITVYRIVLAISIAVLGIIYFIGWKKLMRLYRSYTFTISGNVIIREQVDTPTVKLSFSEVNEIAKHPDGSYTITGKHYQEKIGIPEHIDNRKGLERALNEIRPVVSKAS